MQPFKRLPLALVSCLLLTTISSFSQKKQTLISDSSKIRVEFAFRGETIVIGYDSAFILNPKTFRVYNGAYRSARNGSETVNHLINAYAEALDHRDSMLQTQEYYYQRLKHHFDSVTFNAHQFINNTTVKIDAVDNELAVVGVQLQKTQVLLNDALKLIKEERKQKMKTAVGGFLVGIVSAALIALVAK